MPLADSLVLLGIGLACGVILLGGFLLWLRRRGRNAPAKTEIHVIAERVRAVGRLVALEVSAKEIATVKKGWSWLPPLLLSQARLAMIFQFEKQYWVDLTRLGEERVREIEPGAYRLTLPEIEGSLRLTDVSPYDIQDGRILGLLDVIQMNAATQKNLMERAQEQAGKLFEVNDAKYLAEARRCVERQLKNLLALFGIQVEIVWGDAAASRPDGSSLEAVGSAS
ncbi:MAG: DUF4230 domain-containing protein [Phycisphaeraceae bacterium]|nr:DUF4230 domain-containing protein [Phycisphaeraceae bacterium]